MAIQNELVRYAETHTIKETRLLRRFQIVVLIGNGVAPHLCAWYLQCSLTTVRRWGHPIEETAKLLDKTRPGRPFLFGEETRLKVIAFYCQNPLPGCRNWSLSWAAKYFNAHLEIIGLSISRSTIHRILRTHSLRPHMVKYFLHITDPCFFPKMEKIVRLYQNPPQHLFCFDECTGIQALERLTAKMVTENGIKIEFEYKRHGTRDLYGFLEVRTGRVFGRCTENHCKETLVEVFTEHVNQQRHDAILHYICDNLANHSCELFCKKVAQLSGVHYPSLKTAEERRQWLQSDHKRIIIHFTPYHGSWLNLIEIWFGILKMKCIKGRDFPSRENLSETIYEFLDTWCEHFAHPFNWTYTGDGLAEKVVCRLTNWLLLESKDMKLKFLHKQLRLMVNLVRDYWSQVKRKQWELLYSALIEKDAYLLKIIDGDKNVDQSLTELIQALSLSLPEKNEFVV